MTETKNSEREPWWGDDPFKMIPGAHGELDDPLGLETLSKPEPGQFPKSEDEPWFTGGWSERQMRNIERNQP